jgi:hypothetical protein
MPLGPAARSSPPRASQHGPGVSLGPTPCGHAVPSSLLDGLHARGPFFTGGTSGPHAPVTCPLAGACLWAAGPPASPFPRADAVSFGPEAQLTQQAPFARANTGSLAGGMSGNGTNLMNPPPPNVVNVAFLEARARDPETEGFLVDGVEYRQTVMSDAPPLAWQVWVSEFGDIVLDKNDGGDLIRPAQTMNEGYLYCSVLKQRPGADPYLRRRAHEWVAWAFHGEPPAPEAVVEHLDDDATNNDYRNLAWSDQTSNRARRTANSRSGTTPPGKLRTVLLNIRVVRLIRERTGFKGQKISAYVEQLILADLEPQ